MPAMPSEPSACSIALPCGSRIPDFSVTTMGAFILHPSTRAALTFDQDRSARRRSLALAHNAETPCHLRICFEQSSEIPAKAILVALVVGFHMPQPARTRRNLVGYHDAHELVLPQPSRFHLKIDQPD